MEGKGDNLAARRDGRGRPDAEASDGSSARRGAAAESPRFAVEDLRRHGIRICPEIGHIAMSSSLKPVAAHRHADKIEICYLFSGERVYRREDETFFMRGGDLWINIPGTLHGSCVQPAGASSFYWLLLAPPERAAIFSKETARHIWDTLVSHSSGTFHAEPALRGCFDQILRLAALPGGPVAADRLRATFSLLLFSVLDSLGHPGALRPHPKIRKLLRDLNARRDYSRDTVAGLALRAGMSESYFKTQFRKTVGVPPIRYLRHHWLMRAARELAETAAPIMEIAVKYGYSSSQHFSTVFRHYFCVTPNIYRKRKGLITPEDGGKDGP